MKIAVLIPSRGAPRRLQAVVQAYHELRSGENDTVYCVVCDKDDPDTARACNELADAGMSWFICEGVGNLNSRLNAAARSINADIVTIASDDNFPLAWHWDRIIQQCAEEFDAFSWEEKIEPTNCTYPVLTRKWIQAVGRVFPEYFPFWFADTWIREVYHLAHGQPINIVIGLPMAGWRGATRGMRELGFWFQFFASTRIERVAEAQRVAGRELTKEHLAPILDNMAEWDRLQHARVPQFERAFKAETGVPSARYVAAKEVALQWYKDNGR